MAHHRYQTQALILGSTPIGEANRFVDLFTEDLGRVWAVARSVREERSKLRFSLQDFSLSSVSLVRGKEVWRIVGAEYQQNFYTALDKQKKSQELLVRLVRLTQRLLEGEEENRELFQSLNGTFSFLNKEVLSDEMVSNVECLTALRILYTLGYLAKDARNAAFLESEDMSIDLVAHLSPIRFDVIKQINASLQETQL